MYDREDFNTTLETLRNGGVILYPTETIWGIGCDATNEEAVQRIFAIKRRADGKAMISLVDSLESLEKWVSVIPKAARELIAKADGPVSIIYDHPRGIADSLKAEDGSAAFRITSCPFAADLAKELGSPLVSTSANISGHLSPKAFADIEPEIREAVDYIAFTGREVKGAQASSVFKISDDGTTVKLR